MGRPKKKDSVALQHLGKEIIEEIKATAIKIRRVAMGQGGKTILTNIDQVTGLLIAKRLGMPSISAIADFAKVSRDTLNKLIRDGENGVSEAHRLFFQEYNHQTQITNASLLAQDLAEIASGKMPFKARKQILERNFTEFRPNQPMNVKELNVQNNVLIQQAQEIKNLPTRDLLAKVAELQSKLSPALLERAKESLPAPQDDVIEAEIVCQP